MANSPGASEAADSLAWGPLLAQAPSQIGGGQEFANSIVCYRNLYLKLLDERVEATGLAYARFMDDWVILAPTRWKLREAIRLVNSTLAELPGRRLADGRTVRPTGVPAL